MINEANQETVKYKQLAEKRSSEIHELNNRLAECKKALLEQQADNQCLAVQISALNECLKLQTEQNVSVRMQVLRTKLAMEAAYAAANEVKGDHRTGQWNQTITETITALQRILD